MSIVDCHVKLRCYSMNPHLAALLSGSVCFDYFSPEHTSCTEFGQLHEVVAGDAHIEFDSACGFADRDFCFCKDGQPFGAPCKSITEFLGYVGSGIIEHVGINSKAAKILYIFYYIVEIDGDFLDIFWEFKSSFEQTLEGVEVD